MQTPVGQKCPDDARLPRSAKGLGSPRQLAKALLAAVVVAGAGGVLGGLVAGVTGGLLTILIGYGGGVAMASVVIAAAEGNRGRRFRNIAVIGAVVMVGVMWLVAIGGVLPAGLGILAYVAAIWGVSQRFPWS